MTRMTSKLQYEPTRRCWYIREYRKWRAFYTGHPNQAKLAGLATHSRYVREFYANYLPGGV